MYVHVRRANICKYLQRIAKLWRASEPGFSIHKWSRSARACLFGDEDSKNDPPPFTVKVYRQNMLCLLYHRCLIFFSLFSIWFHDVWNILSTLTSSESILSIVVGYNLTNYHESLKKLSSRIQRKCRKSSVSSWWCSSKNRKSNISSSDSLSASDSVNSLEGFGQDDDGMKDRVTINLVNLIFDMFVLLLHQMCLHTSLICTVWYHWSFTPHFAKNTSTWSYPMMDGGQLFLWQYPSLTWSRKIFWVPIYQKITCYKMQWRLKFSICSSTSRNVQSIFFSWTFLFLQNPRLQMTSLVRAVVRLLILFHCWIAKPIRIRNPTFSLGMLCFFSKSEEILFIWVPAHLIISMIPGTFLRLCAILDQLGMAWYMSMFLILRPKLTMERRLCRLQTKIVTCPWQI